MRRSRPTDWRMVGLALGIGALAIIAGLIVPVCSPRDRGRVLRVGTLMDSNNYAEALSAYSTIYRSLPFGNNATVTTALRGSNLHRHVFLYTTTQALNARGEFLDVLQRPYEIEVNSNGFRFKSLSK